MNYRYELELPASGSATDPEVSARLLPKGVIRHVRIYFPAGCCGLAHVRITVDETQVWPSTSGDWFAGEDGAIEFEENYPLTEAWHWVEVLGYNEDTAQTHTITVQLTVEAAAVVGKYPRLEQFLDALRGV